MRCHSTFMPAMGQTRRIKAVGDEPDLHYFAGNVERSHEHRTRFSDRFVGMQSASQCHKPLFLIAVGRVWDLCVLQ